MKITERETLQMLRSHIGEDCKKKKRDCRQEELEMRREKMKKGDKYGGKDEEDASQRNKKRKSMKKPRGWNNGRKLLGKINEG